MDGVKNDSIVELENFGEFILKFSPANEGKKSVEFLPTQAVEDQLSGSIPIAFPEAKTTAAVEGNKPQAGEKFLTEDIEEELRKKREAILRKLTVPSVSKQPEAKTQVPEAPETDREKPTQEQEPILTQASPVESVIPEDESQRSFSDYFSVVSDAPQMSVPSEALSPESENREERVIPPSAVELHEEIVSPALSTPSPQAADMQSAGAYQTETVPLPRDFRTNGKPYYIWYRDSEPSPQETQTLQVEYELLYQAQKEAEYRSKLKIYVTSFIMFFSFVLILLVFSPVIYKVFFTPEETEYIYQQEETPAEEISSTPTPEPESNPPVANQEHQSGITSPQPTEQTGQTTPPQQQTQTQQTQTPTAEKKTEVTTEPPQPTGQKTEQPSVESAPLQGLTKNSLGWTDEKYKVIYIALENNKYAIQESAWDSEAKAMGRIKSVAGLSIEGMTGSVVRVDLGDKGIWYRARFGEFSSLEEARKKAIELRTKERTRLSAVIVLFLSLA